MNHGVGVARVPPDGWCRRCVEDREAARWANTVGGDTSHAQQMLEVAGAGAPRHPGSTHTKGGNCLMGRQLSGAI